jgi:hypothetical protein
MADEDRNRDVREEAAKKRAALRDRTSEWLTEHWSSDGSPCPFCKGSDWSVHEPVGMQPYGFPPFEGAVFPTCPITCTTCGYTVFIDVLATGIMDATEAAEAVEATETNA